MGTTSGIRQITTQSANIKTATVEVRVLTLSGKQMTLSVFCQLQKEDLIDMQSGELKGIPWGRVNYSPGGCCSETKHLHVVWQKGNQLRRACVFADWQDRGISDWWAKQLREASPEEQEQMLTEFSYNYSQSYSAIAATDQLFIAV